MKRSAARLLLVLGLASRVGAASYVDVTQSPATVNLLVKAEQLAAGSQTVTGGTQLSIALYDEDSTRWPDPPDTAVTIAMPNTVTLTGGGLTYDVNLSLSSTTAPPQLVGDTWWAYLTWADSSVGPPYDPVIYTFDLAASLTRTFTAADRGGTYSGTIPITLSTTYP